MCDRPDREPWATFTPRTSRGRNVAIPRDSTIGLGRLPVSMLRESVNPNCSVNLSVSGNGDVDHDDLEGATTGMGPDARPEARTDDDRGAGLVGPSERQLWRLRSTFERDGPAGRSLSSPVRHQAKAVPATG